MSFLHQLIFAGLCIVLVSRFWHAKFSFHVEYNVLFHVEIEYIPTKKYKFFSPQNGLSS
jgi:hypothetical protein